MSAAQGRDGRAPLRDHRSRSPRHSPCASRSRRSHFADPSHTLALSSVFSPARPRRTLERESAKATLSVACPATPARCYSPTRRRHSRIAPGRRDWSPSCNRTGRNWWRFAAGICTRTVTRGTGRKRASDREVVSSGAVPPLELLRVVVVVVETLAKRIVKKSGRRYGRFRGPHALRSLSRKSKRERRRLNSSLSLPRRRSAGSAGTSQCHKSW